MTAAHGALEDGRRRPGVPAVVRVLLGLSLAGLALFAAHTAFGLGGQRLYSFFNLWVYNALILLSVAVCALRAALVRAERAAWLVLSVVLAAWAAGEIVFSVAYGGKPPFPSVADALYLAFSRGATSPSSSSCARVCRSSTRACGWTA